MSLIQDVLTDVDHISPTIGASLVSSPPTTKYSPVDEEEQFYKKYKNLRRFRRRGVGPDYSKRSKPFTDGYSYVDSENRHYR